MIAMPTVHVIGISREVPYEDVALRSDRDTNGEQTLERYQEIQRREFETLSLLYNKVSEGDLRADREKTRPI